jgi:hypothetical protein
MLAINQLIKIIIGVVVISVVVVGLYFFGSYVADFFGNMVGGEEEKQEGVQVIDSKQEKLIQEISATFCEDECYDGVGCPFWECTAISNKISQYGKKCDFSWGFVSGNDCITVNK